MGLEAREHSQVNAWVGQVEKLKAWKAENGERPDRKRGIGIDIIINR
jgi:hypothetical protein